jgi:RND superfamily putative drug exporter
MALRLSTEALARTSARHPWTVVGIWLVALLASGVTIATLLGGALTTNEDFTNSPESKRANALLEAGFQDLEGPRRPNETVIVQSSSAIVDEPAFRQFVERLYADMIALGPTVVAGGSHYYMAGDGSLVSADKRNTLLPLMVNDREIDLVLQTLQRAERPDGFQVYIFGGASIDKEFTELAERDLSAEFRIGIPAALVVLVIVFGALAAAAVPLVVAFASIAVALALTALVGQAFQFSFFVTNMVSMMGLAVGIDYSLLGVSRYREERARGLPKLEAIAAVGATANRTAFFSGIMVIVALIGMLITPFTIFRSLSAGAMLVVLSALLSALTLLPAVLSLLGDRVNSLRIPLVGRRAAATRQTGFWDRVTRLVMRFPVVSLLLTGGLLAAASFWAFSLEIGGAGVSSLPDRFQAKQAFLILQEEFHFELGGRAVIAISGDLQSAPVQAAVERLQAALSADPAFAGQPSLLVHPNGNIARLSMGVAGEPTSQAAQDAISRLRDQHIPTAFAGVPAEALVAGNIAENADFFALTNTYMPIVFAIVLALSFVLLTVVFRSLVVPVKAILMNLLSVGASYGLLVLVFQRGYGADLLGFQQSDQIEAWIPIFLFSVLFGLSMDYHVFLLTRIRERFDQTRQNDEAVAFGLRSTAGIITGAALIMVGVFAGFAAGELVMFQQVGFGLAVAVLLDATIVRSVLVPATMKLLGDRNWYLPKALRWLPAVHVERAAEMARSE